MGPGAGVAAAAERGGPRSPGSRSRPFRDPDGPLEEFEQSGLFSNAVAMQFDWNTVYSSGSDIELLDTFTNHIAMTQTH